jgi:4-carboxymuconolactone decarboxylase
VSYLPTVSQHFTQAPPGGARLLGGLAKQCRGAGPRAARPRRLVKLGIAVGLNSEGAVRSHTRQALEAGISAEEVEHVILLALTTVGFPTMIAAYKWAHEVMTAAQRHEPI